MIKRPPVNAASSERFAGPLLFVTDSGKKVFGSEAFCNHGNHLRLTIKPAPRGGTWAFVRMNVPKLQYGDNVHSASREDLETVIDFVGQWLENIGVRCDFRQSPLSRVDVARNVVLSDPFVSYRPMLRCLCPQSNMKPLPMFETGLYWKNKSNETLATYEKKQEALKHGYAWDPSWPTIARVESRLFGKEKISRLLGTEQLADLVDAYDTLPTFFRKHMQRHLFAVDMADLPAGTTVQRDPVPRLLAACRDADERSRPRNRAYKMLALRMLLEGGMSPEEIVELDRSVFGESSRARRSLEEACTFAASSIIEPLTGRTFASLYEELRDQTLA